MSMGPSASHGLVVRPPKSVHPPAGLSSPPGPAAPPLLVALVALLLFAVGLLSSIVLRRQLWQMVAAADEAALARANTALAQALDEKRERALANVKLLVDESRVRATVITPNFDEATVTDVLDDLRAASGATVLAVLNVAGKVQARSGADLLRQVDLGSVKAVTAALEGPTAVVWTLPERVVVMAAAPIRSAAGVASLMMIGFEVGGVALAAIERLDGVRGAVVIGDRVVDATTRSPDTAAVFAAARSLPEAGGTLAATEGELLVRSARVGESALAGRVIWILPRHHGAAAIARLTKVAWAPAALVAMMLALLGLSLRRR
jgi:hypothetical protein